MGFNWNPYLRWSSWGPQTWSQRLPTLSSPQIVWRGPYTNQQPTLSVVAMYHVNHVCTVYVMRWYVFGGLEHVLFSHIIIGNNHPNMWCILASQKPLIFSTLRIQCAHVPPPTDITGRDESTRGDSIRTQNAVVSPHQGTKNHIEPPHKLS